MNTPDFVNVFIWVYTRLEPFRKKQFWILFSAMVLVAFIETVSLGSIAFFASAVTDPGNVKTSKYVWAIKQIVHAAFLDSSRELILASGAFMCILMAAKNTLKGLSQYGMARFSTAMEAYFGGKLLEGFLRMPYQWHLSRNSADLINAIQWRIYLGRNFFRPTLNILNDALMVTVMLTALFIVQPMVSFFVTLVVSGSAFFIYKVIRKKIDRTASISKNYQLEIHKESAMSIQGIKDIKISGTQDMFISMFFEKAIPLSKIFGLQMTYALSPVLILETIGFLILFSSICIMLLMFNITTAYMTGTMALLAVTAWKMLPAISQVLNGLSTIRNALPFIYTLMGYEEQIASIRTEPVDKKHALISLCSAVTLENVSFSYKQSHRKILNKLSFTINKGETVGIVGRSGAGKTTLVNLLTGLLEPVSGTITIDGQALTREQVPSWCKFIGYVPQSSFIYDGTLAQNIAFGVTRQNVNRSLIRHCCKMASLEEFICDLPEGIDTFIGERGVKLSGGQQQRVAIARALYRKPEILIFDEATSSLDTKNEKSIQDTIYSFKGTQTLIIIAHRLSTVEACDKLIWLEKGEVKMMGSPDIILELYEKHQSNR